MNGCTAPIMRMWPMCEIARSPTATSNTSRCSSREAGRADDRAVLVDVGDDLLDLLVAVAERLQRERDGAVDDRHLAAADQLLELDEREVGLDAGRVAVHQEARSSLSARAPSPARCGSRAPRRARPPRPRRAAPRPAARRRAARVVDLVAASRCIRITRVVGIAVALVVLVGPSAAATRADCAYARPVISAVIAAAVARPRRSRRACRWTSDRRRGWRSRGRAGGTRAR